MTHVLIVANRFSEVSRDPINRLKNQGWDVIERYHEIGTLREDVFCELIRDVEAVIVSATEVVNRRVIEAARRLRIIAVRGVGYQGVDLEAATQKRVMVTNTPGGNADAVADLTLGFMIALARQIPLIDRKMRGGAWYRVRTGDVYGQTLGLVGLGEIGKKVVRRVSGFNMKIITYDIVKDPGFAEQFNLRYASIEEVLASSDFVSIHIPLSESTQSLIGKKEFALMKKTAFLINTSRGGVVDEKALYDALKEQRIAGAACDVFSQEPTQNLKLVTLDNMISTPHIAGYSDKSWSILAEMAVDNVIAALNNKVPPNLLNPEVIPDKGSAQYSP